MPFIPPDLEVGQRARKRIAWRLLPFLFLLYVIAFLDRMNVGAAALQMPGDLGFNDRVVGLGAGMFFLGYLVLVLVGAAEAGFFPAVIVYISHWFRTEDRAKAVACFYAANPLSYVIGSPLAGWLLGISWLGLRGWRWLFILEGIPAIVFGVITVFYLTDWPRQASWLREDERDWLSTQLEREKQAKQRARSYTVWQALSHRDVILLTLCYFCATTGGYGIAFWLPTILKRLSGQSDIQVTLFA